MTLQERIHQICLQVAGDVYFDLLTHELRQTHGLTVNLSSFHDIMRLDETLAEAALAALPRYTAQPVPKSLVFATMCR